MAEMDNGREVSYIRRDLGKLEDKFEKHETNYRNNFFENDDSVVNRLKTLEGQALFVRWCFGLIGALIVVAIATNLLKIAIPEFRSETSIEHPIGKNPP